MPKAELICHAILNSLLSNNLHPIKHTNLTKEQDDELNKDFELNIVFDNHDIQISVTDLNRPKDELKDKPPTSNAH